MFYNDSDLFIYKPHSNSNAVSPENNISPKPILLPMHGVTPRPLAISMKSWGLRA